MMKPFKSLSYFFFLMMVAVTSNAATLQIYPLRLDLDASKPRSMLTLVNKGNQPTLIQVEPMLWTQENGKDVYKKSTNLIATPAVIQIPASEQQIIRIGLKQPRRSQEEVAYRVFFQEVDTSKAEETPSGMKILLRMGVPIFVGPVSEVKQFVWTAHKKPNNKLSVTLNNQSNVHIKLSKFEFYTPQGNTPLFSEDVFAYVLPHQTRTWEFTLPSNTSYASLKMAVKTDQGELVESISMPST